ncbi:four helix bundle protein [Desulfonatronovibrio hydrogenovorans]|uniref:four helix bundle protein n=1 Tax=Desulfonatronovibrio hydrogenovorans TaxID=53245 RepID=UPI00048F536C|nr:four helix bundle protein [Desulfonatronovibrio hydrogenovorans]
MQNFTLYQKIDDMSNYLFPVVERFPKSEKFALCTQIKNCVHTMIMNVIRMQKIHPKNIREKLRWARETDCRLEMLQHFIRHAHSRRYLSNKRLRLITEKLVELGRIIGGLIRRFSGAHS